MRIERIDSLAGVGKWLIDQAGHTLIALVPTGLFIFLDRNPLVGLGAGFGLLAVRELVQWFGKDRSDANWIMVIDPVLDVILGTLGAALVLWVAIKIGWLP